MATMLKVLQQHEGERHRYKGVRRGTGGPQAHTALAPRLSSATRQLKRSIPSGYTGSGCKQSRDAKECKEHLEGCKVARRASGGRHPIEAPATEQGIPILYRWPGTSGQMQRLEEEEEEITLKAWL